MEPLSEEVLERRFLVAVRDLLLQSFPGIEIEALEDLSDNTLGIYIPLDEYGARSSFWTSRKETWSATLHSGPEDEPFSFIHKGKEISLLTTNVPSPWACKDLFDPPLPEAVAAAIKDKVYAIAKILPPVIFS